MSHLTRAAPGGLWRRPRRSRPRDPSGLRTAPRAELRGTGQSTGRDTGEQSGWGPEGRDGRGAQGDTAMRGRGGNGEHGAHGGWKPHTAPPGPATLHPPPGSPRGPARRRQVPGKAPAPHGGRPPAPHRETSSTFSPAGAPPGTDRPPPAPAPLTHGVHRSLNSLATVSMPPARATAM